MENDDQCRILAENDIGDDSFVFQQLVSIRKEF